MIIILELGDSYSWFKFRTRVIIAQDRVVALEESSLLLTLPSYSSHHDMMFPMLIYTLSLVGLVGREE